ncbi:MAG: trypsin-like serine protease [Cycloclasticus sp.]|nr:trypsin-like serine protease [Cycloclasticus sp.]MBQ0790088.1 trypsin-like serine protease [Cycloclasticus sp.]
MSEHKKAPPLRSSFTKKTPLPITKLVSIVFALAIVSPLLYAERVLDGDKLSGIKGIDDRVLVNGAHKPWQAIGKIYTADLALCTGVLITPNHVLTAAHCIWNKNTNSPIDNQHLEFVTGYHRERFLAGRSVRHVRHSPRYKSDQNSSVSLHSLTSDWAILALESAIYNVTPIPISSLTMQELMAAKQTLAVIQAGYSGDRPYILTANKRCKVTKKYHNQPLIGHDCDATKGDSGSPLLVKINGQFQLIAIHVGTEQHSNGRSVGVAITPPFTPTKSLTSKEPSLPF